jgi:hypothetical protein
MSQTFVTGGRVERCLALAGAGVASSEVDELEPGVAAAPEGAAGGFAALAARDSVGGEGLGRTGGAVAPVGGGLVLAWPAAAISEGSSSGRRDAPAKEALGAGPIAAPTATPIASIPPASAALMRGEGVRGKPEGDGLGSPGTASVASAAGSPVRVVEVSRLSAMA